MNDTIVVAIITFFASIGSAAIVSISNRDKTIQAVRDEIRTIREESKEADQKTHEEIALVRKDITTLSDRVEKHNSVIERVYKLEQDSAVQAEKINGLERSGK